MWTMSVLIVNHPAYYKIHTSHYYYLQDPARGRRVTDIAIALLNDVIF